MKLVINVNHGGFGLSREALLELRKRGNKVALEETDVGELWPGTDSVREDVLDDFCRFIPRDDPDLVAVVRKLGDKANGECASLKIVDIPNDVAWELFEFAGEEEIHEVHRKWS